MDMSNDAELPQPTATLAVFLPADSEPMGSGWVFRCRGTQINLSRVRLRRRIDALRRLEQRLLAGRMQR